MTTVAQRPDGTRITFRPYATPLLSEEGELRGAVNILIDETEKHQAWELRTQAVRCRRLADCVRGDPANGILLQMAQKCEQKAFELEWRVRKVVDPSDRPLA